jgi:hypothetical protein
MQHMPAVKDSIFPPIKVPCLSLDSYDNEIGHFEDYPRLKGQDLQALKRGKFSHQPADVTAGFLQDWLFFGLLYEVLGQQGQKWAFVTLDPGSDQMVVNTGKLHQVLQARCLDYVEPPPVYHVRWDRLILDFERLDKVLRIVSLFCSVASDCESDVTKPGVSIWPLSPEVDFSIRALGHHITRALYSASWDLDASNIVRHGGAPLVSTTLSFPPGDYAASRMREASWCPSEITMVSERMSPSSLYYISSLRRYQIRKDHTQCTEQLCAANQIESSKYKTAHTEDNCTCNHLNVPIKQLVSIIAKDGIPIVTITQSQDGSEPSLEVSRFRHDQHYVAISHVWSDGLGNADTNSLPACQLQRLKNLLDEITWTNDKPWDSLNKGHINKYWRRWRGQSVAFWLDTLCIPVERKWKDYRDKSIMKMYDIYRNAKEVLILDSELQSTPLTSSVDEAFMRVNISGWMRRLWTLQESVLGRRLHVKFRDGIVDLTAEHSKNSSQKPPLTFHHHAGTPDSDSRRFYWEDRTLRFLITEKRERKFIGIFTQTTRYSDPAEDKIRLECDAILRAFVQSNFRSSSRKSDEFRCLASLLGWDTSRLKGLPVGQRMKALLEQKEILPQGLLFIAGQRIPEMGWRWALQNFGNNGSRQLNVFGARFDAKPARRSAQGLSVEYAGFVIAADQRPESPDDFIVEVPGFQHEETWILHVGRHDDNCRRIDEAALNAGEDALTFGTTSSQSALTIFFYNPNAQPALNIFMAAVMADVDCGSEYLVDATDPVVHCTYRDLATIQVLGRKGEAGTTSGTINPTAFECVVSGD